YLTKAGARVHVVANGREAVDAALVADPTSPSNEPFDVVLMDMQMPVLDGYRAATELRQQGYVGPIIALTAHAMREDESKCLAAGCDHYLPKPIDRRKLIQLIADVGRPRLQ